MCCHITLIGYVCVCGLLCLCVCVCMCVVMVVYVCVCVCVVMVVCVWLVGMVEKCMIGVKIGRRVCLGGGYCVRQVSYAVFLPKFG